MKNLKKLKYTYENGLHVDKYQIVNNLEQKYYALAMISFELFIYWLTSGTFI